MWFLTELAERRIAQARDAGEFDNLPGAGAPLPDDELDPLVPEHQRIAYRVLKNAGYIPPELEMHQEAVALSLKLAAADEVNVDAAMLARLEKINLLLRQSGHAALTVPVRYAAGIEARLRSSSTKG
ncbi:DnaJ family domain-containing protein [Andreprevotia chitinilytica]|uniref:DnaJ family domain-containing protein n=1 Tax=Andreprevotia chitinilytica TaxID=396808 RepID=UPI000556BF6C|nr:DnaJ family domain-containing protein [Andreprevotia chitinilytica]